MFLRRNNASDPGSLGSSMEGSNSSPLREISTLLDKLKLSVDASMNVFLDGMINAIAGSGDNEVQQRRWLRRFRRGEHQGQAAPVEAEPATAAAGAPAENKSENTKSQPKKTFRKNRQPNARFAPMTDAETASLVETIRRISELVVIGERASADVQSEEDKLRALVKQQKDDEKASESRSGDSVDEEEKRRREQLENECAKIREKISEKKAYAYVYDHFFERNGLSTIADILTGKAFDLPGFFEKRKQTVKAELEGYEKILEESKAEEEQKEQETSKGLKKRSEAIMKALDTIKESETYANTVLLPPLAVAIQGFQSTSILVQNVKRATSLFFILSNNHINQLIGIPLEEYHIAERSKLEGGNKNSAGTPNLMSPRRFASPELGELATTFVSFLKSLAMRMNAETLQFFLTYPADTAIVSDTDLFEEAQHNIDCHDDDDEEIPLDEIMSNSRTKPELPANRPVAVKTIKVEFPLYERALEFCAAHHDSFIRTTAMNICLNTLRLSTVEAKTKEEEPGEVAEAVNLEAASGDSPDGVLHNAKALPMRERLAIAQYVCTPSRVEKLASPIFTKLAQLWGVLEEQFRDMEIAGKVGQSIGNANGSGNDDDIPKKANEKIARARELARRKKYTGIFNDTSYNLQDELLLLDDMFKVGLTSLNEQVIEMMFATFAYPLLLQPLLLYFQRSPVAAEVLFADTLNEHSLGSQIKQSDATATEKAVISGPAKSALFCLAAAFQFLTNPPLLRLLFTAVFHPLSPNAAGETMIRAKADVACMGKDGRATIRIDRFDENGKMVFDQNRETYVFGTVTGRKEVSGRRSGNQTGNQDDACVFVLAPALSEIFNFTGQDGGLVARSRHNPYRKAIFQCFTLNREVSDLQDLTVMAVYSAVSVLNEKFLVDLLFGLDIKRYRENLPKDKRFDSFRGSSTDSFEDDFDDRGMGGTIASTVDSRLSLGALEGGKIGFDYMNEVIVSFQRCILNAVPGNSGAWKLNYDLVAANALLTCVRGNSEAIMRASEAIKTRYRQASIFLADIPATIDTLFDCGRLWNKLKHLVPANGTEEEKNVLYYGAIMDMIARLNNGSDGAPVESILHNMLYFTKGVPDKTGHVSLYVSVSSLCSYNDVGARATACSPLEQGDAAGAAFSNAVESTSALLKLNSLVSLINGLVNDKDMLRDQKIGGFIFNGTTELMVSNPSDGKTIYSPISDEFDSALFGTESKPGTLREELKPGSVTTLVGKMAYPCVCEVPPSMAPLFSEEGAKVVSQGVTWQSLYLVIMDEDLVLVEPERRPNGKGRVVTLCRLENLTLDRDPDNARVDTSARRLMLICESPDLKPPGMFRFEKKLQPQQLGPFSRCNRWKSSLDIWFEDSNALHAAFTKVFESVVRAKASRGSRIRKYLSGGEI
ncbi:unnamed protein product [Pseudo-nitzschia multistriata]|uniref:FPL domain-containing protein n=1 Tax=Pseudo-nitzschia multistriata TaxID=183589 RepID=A0A448Z663_9STRA|nr:unnamed protein product [Pseudo-nitzschia multistriata]